MTDQPGIQTIKEKTAAFSGHRRIVPPVQVSLFGAPAEQENYIDIIRSKTDRAVAALIAEGYDTFLCGMAVGFDIMAGLAVCRRIEAGESVRLIALIPHPGQAAKFSAPDKEIYNKVLSFASETHTVCPEYSHDCFHRRNDLLVEYSSVLICYYDGNPGGTHYTVKKALRQGHRVVNML